MCDICQIKLLQNFYWLCSSNRIDRGLKLCQLINFHRFKDLSNPIIILIVLLLQYQIHYILLYDVVLYNNVCIYSFSFDISSNHYEILTEYVYSFSFIEACGPCYLAITCKTQYYIIVWFHRKLNYIDTCILGKFKNKIKRVSTGINLFSAFE